MVRPPKGEDGARKFHGKNTRHGGVYGFLPVRTLDMVGCVTLKRLSIRGAGPIPRHGDDDGDLACVRCGCSVVLEFLSAH